MTKDKCHAGLCADIDADEAAFMYASQGAFYAKGFTSPITNAAWRHKPAYGLIATEIKALTLRYKEICTAARTRK